MSMFRNLLMASKEDVDITLEIYSENELFCRYSYARDFRKKYSGKSLKGYYTWTQWTGPILVGNTIKDATYCWGNYNGPCPNIVGSLGSFVYKNKVWYYSDTGAWYSGIWSDNSGTGTIYLGRFSTALEAAQYLVRKYYKEV